MAYENLMTGQPQNLYQKKKRERETFEAMERQKRFAADRGNVMALGQPQPVEELSLLDSITKKRDEFLGPRPIDIEEYEAARNPLFTYESTPGASTYETPAGVPSVGMGGKLTPEARQNYPAGGHHPGVETNQPGNIPVAEGGSGMHPGMETGYQPVYGKENPKPKEVTHTDYTKSIDKSFLAAMLQSAIPQKKEDTQARAVSSGGVGRTTMPEMTPFLTGLRPKRKNPALWRYS
jgi:hypothetical protein